jgi:hypothetical protein
VSSLLSSCLSVVAENGRNAKNARNAERDEGKDGVRAQVDEKGERDVVRELRARPVRHHNDEAEEDGGEDDESAVEEALSRTAKIFGVQLFSALKTKQTREENAVDDRPRDEESREEGGGREEEGCEEEGGGVCEQEGGGDCEEEAAAEGVGGGRGRRHIVFYLEGDRHLQLFIALFI